MPVSRRRLVNRMEFISRYDLRSRPHEKFVFGDNMDRTGYGGQAAQMRDEPNAIGVATLYAPGDRFRPGDPAALHSVVLDLAIVAKALVDGITVNVPTNLPGSGLAQLSARWPELQALIEAFFAAAETVEG